MCSITVSIIKDKKKTALVGAAMASIAEPEWVLGCQLQSQSIDRDMAETPAPVTRTKSEKKMKWDEKNLIENEAIQVSME